MVLRNYSDDKDILDLIEKSDPMGPHKYIKREGKPGHYKYHYYDDKMGVHRQHELINEVHKEIHDKLLKTIKDYHIPQANKMVSVRGQMNEENAELISHNMLHSLDGYLYTLSSDVYKRMLHFISDS